VVPSTKTPSSFFDFKDEQEKSGMTRKHRNRKSESVGKFFALTMERYLSVVGGQG
jgi:hypothetical protein